MSSTSVNGVFGVRFLHPDGQADVRADLDTVLNSATKSLRGAVCFFTEPGRMILSRHHSQLNHPASFFVAGVDSPTNLDSLEKLHRIAPGHVYIHLGGSTPSEKKVGRSLMHSKVFVAEGASRSKVWVGSHNLTAMAIGGGNFEAGVIVDSSPTSQVATDAVAHLDACRLTAELFDPNEMERYREIQKRRRGDSDWDIERDVLVIHAEANPAPSQPAFILHIHISPVELDKLFQMDRQVRLFIHPTGTLQPGLAANYRQAQLWNGEVTAVVRTEYHPQNRGASAQFENADFDIDIPNLDTIPQIIGSGGSAIRARTQVVMRFDRRGEVGREVFSISSRTPIRQVLDEDHPLEMHEVDKDLIKYFTPESVESGHLVFRPVRGVRHDLEIEGYEETMRSRLLESSDERGWISQDERVQYSAQHPKNEIDPFFYLSRFTVRPK